MKCCETAGGLAKLDGLVYLESMTRYLLIAPGSRAGSALLSDIPGGGSRSR